MSRTVFALAVAAVAVAPSPAVLTATAAPAITTEVSRAPTTEVSARPERVYGGRGRRVDIMAGLSGLAGDELVDEGDVGVIRDGVVVDLQDGVVVVEGLVRPVVGPGPDAAVRSAGVLVLREHQLGVDPLPVRENAFVDRDPGGRQGAAHGAAHGLTRHHGDVRAGALLRRQRLGDPGS